MGLLARGAQRSRTSPVWHFSERPDLHALQWDFTLFGDRSTRRRGAWVDDVDAFDFYSCFPVAVEVACDMLGLDESDPRGFTVTGGLPYAGGPGNAYTIHSLAAMVERLRRGPGCPHRARHGKRLVPHQARGDGALALNRVSALGPTRRR